MSDQEKSQSSGHEQTRENAPPQQRGDRAATRQSGGGGGGRRRFQQNQPRRPEPALNMDELRELIELFTSHGLTDFELEREDLRIRLRRDLAAQNAQPVTAELQHTTAPPAGATSSTLAATAPQTSPVTATGAGGGAGAPDASTMTAPTVPPSFTALAGGQETGARAASEDKDRGEDLHIITSPIVGTFYRAPSPTVEPFVRVGINVEPDTVVCIIEAMKLMNEILAETSGVVEKIYVENAQPVEYNQPLFGIRK